MFQLSHKRLVIASGILWLLIGSMLFQKGVNLFKLLMQEEAGALPMINFFGSMTSNRDESLVVLISLALIVGLFKGRVILAKSVKRVVTRICALPNPSPLKDVYSVGYYVLILSMMMLGMLMKWAQVSVDVRGFIDLAVGTALIQGAILYFRQAQKISNPANS
jgi:hypothetical protein